MFRKLLSLQQIRRTNFLLTGLEPRLEQIIRASNSADLLEAHKKFKRDPNLSYFEKQTNQIKKSSQ